MNKRKPAASTTIADVFWANDRCFHALEGSCLSHDGRVE
jgi:hypothetical protein